MGYFDEFGQCTSYVDYHDPNWSNLHDYGWYNHCVSNDSLNFYDFQPQPVQYDSKPSWRLDIERLMNDSNQTIKKVAFGSKPP